MEIKPKVVDYKSLKLNRTIYMKNQMYITLIILPLLAGCGNKKEMAHTIPTPEINVAHPSVQDITLTKSYPGYLTSEKTVDLVGRVSGTLQSIAYSPGNRVYQGQVLFQIEPTIYQNNVRQAKLLSIQHAQILSMHKAIIHVCRKRQKRMPSVKYRYYNPSQM